MLKRFLTPRQWRMILLLSALYAAYEVISTFVKRSFGWNPRLFNLTNSLGLNIAFSVIIYTLVFAALIVLLTHYMYGPEDEKGQR